MLKCLQLGMFLCAFALSPSLPPYCLVLQVGQRPQLRYDLLRRKKQRVSELYLNLPADEDFLMRYSLAEYSPQFFVDYLSVYEASRAAFQPAAEAKCPIPLW